MTEQRFQRILTVTIWGILLCLAGLVGTTWVWCGMDAVCQRSVTRTGQFAAEVTVYQGEELLCAGEQNTYILTAGIYTIRIDLLDGSTAPGHFELRLGTWEQFLKTAPLYPNGERTCLCFTLNVIQDTMDLEFSPVLGIPGDGGLITDGAQINTDSQISPSLAGVPGIDFRNTKWYNAVR